MAVRVAPGADSQHTVYAPPERAKYIRGDRQGQPHLSFALAKNRSCETTPYLHTDQSQSPIAHGGQRRITQDEYDKKARELKGRQNEIALRIEQHQEGEGDYRTTLESLISVASRAADIFERSKTEQKRELIAFVFSNLRLKGKKARIFIAFTLRPNGQPGRSYKLADEPVLGEPVSGQIPCYQGKKQGISQNR